MACLLTYKCLFVDALNTLRNKLIHRSSVDYKLYLVKAYYESNTAIDFNIK